MRISKLLMAAAVYWLGVERSSSVSTNKDDVLSNESLSLVGAAAFASTNLPAPYPNLWNKIPELGEPLPRIEVHLPLEPLKINIDASWFNNPDDKPLNEKFIEPMIRLVDPSPIPNSDQVSGWKISLGAGAAQAIAKVRLEIPSGGKSTSAFFKRTSLELEIFNHGMELINKLLNEEVSLEYIRVWVDSRIEKIEDDIHKIEALNTRNEDGTFNDILTEKKCEVLSKMIDRLSTWISISNLLSEDSAAEHRAVCDLRR